MEITSERDALTASLSTLQEKMNSLQKSEIENSSKDDFYKQEIEQLKMEIQSLQQLHGACEQSNETLNQQAIQLEKDYQFILEENEKSVQIINDLQNEIQTLSVFVIPF